MFQAAIERYLIYTSLLVAPLAIGCCWLLTRAIVSPLSRMKKLTGSIAKGDYRVCVQVKSKDEIGDLANSFNQMSAELEKIERLRRQVVADVAHELRMPLTTVRGYVEAMKDGILPANAELLTRCYAEVERVVRLVEDIHRLTQLENKLKESGTELPIEPEKVILEAVSLYKPKWAEKGLTYEGECRLGNMVKVRIGRDLLMQVLVNLFENTVRHTPEGNTIHVKVEKRKGKCNIEVTNTGAQIPDQHLPHIFERFYRVEESRSRAQGGVGLGLAIVRDIVHSVGGVVFATSENRATTIHIQLPCVQ